MSSRSAWRAVPAALCAATLAGCDAPMSALGPAGRNADGIHFLWTVMLWGSAAISLFVFAIAAFAVIARSRFAPPVGLLLWGGGLAFPLIILPILLVLGMRAGEAVTRTDDIDAFVVDVTGHQWWWEFAYTDAEGRRMFSANEAHIPAGRPVRFNISSADVIHSLWVPRLSGKVDAIPGITNRLAFDASAAGVYRGACAEFCGAQHARMSFTIHAHDETALNERMRQLAEARREAPPAFARHCAQCHSLDPFTRGAAIAPNLADLPLRERIGGGALANTSESLRAWITNHQRIKPGNKMALFAGSERELEEIISFLEPRS